jgi:hypothetical protein
MVMKKTNRATQADIRIKQLLVALMKDFNTTEFRPFDSALYRETYKVGAAYIGALKELKAVESPRGMLKLTERFYSLRPSTVRKSMTKLVTDSVLAKNTPAPVASPVYNIDTIKAQLRLEILEEILAKLK